MIPIGDEAERAQAVGAVRPELFEEHSLAREGFRLAMRGLLVLITMAWRGWPQAAPAPAP